MPYPLGHRVYIHEVKSSGLGMLRLHELLSPALTAPFAAARHCSASVPENLALATMLNTLVTLAGLEPAIFGSEDRCLIHWATGSIFMK